MIIKSYEGAYERSVVIEITNGKCKVCGKETKVLKIDGSDGEYSAGAICKECTDEAFTREAVENVKESMENPQDAKDFIKLTACLTNLQTCTADGLEKYEIGDVVIAYNSDPIAFKKQINKWLEDIDPKIN